MNKVIIINLNGIAYQLEEDGYEALRAYLDSAAGRLAGNPDKGEIIADIEQSIADKFRSVLGANKTVVMTREVQDVIAEMGPVQDDSFPTPGAPGAAAPGTRTPSSAGPIPAAGPAAGKAKRLYRLRDGAKIGGVCNGLAAYCGTDVTLIRILFAIVGVSFGAGILLYILLMVFIPWANTPAEVADAHGDPSTAEDIIKRAKEGYYSGMKSFNDPANYRQWKRRVRQEMRQHRRDLRDTWKRNMHDWHWNWHWPHHDQTPGAPVHPGWWVAMPFAGFLSTVVTILFVMALLSLLTTHAIFGFYLPYGIPFWIQIVGLIMLFNAVKWPLRAMRYGYHPLGSPGYWSPFAALWHSVAWIGFLVFAVWLLNHNSHAHQALEAGRDQAHEWIHQFKDWWDRQ
jgi:phage shock protein PspC (stress-responsive transcriptional regulator)